MGKGGYQRFSPRSKKSNWTQLNVARCERLEKLGLMTDSGRVVMPKIDFIVASHILEALKKCDITYKNYEALPEIYKRVRIDNIQSWFGIENNTTHDKRLQKFLENTKQNKLFGDWNDRGRLL